MGNTPSHGYEILGTYESSDFEYIFLQPLNTDVKDIFAAVLINEDTGLTFSIEDREIYIYHGDDNGCDFCGTKDAEIQTTKGLYPIPKTEHEVVPYNQSEEIWVYFCEKCWVQIRNQLDLDDYDDLSKLMARKL